MKVRKMTNNQEVLFDYISLIDSHEINFYSISGNNAFIISHHLKDKSEIERNVKKLLESGFTYFNILVNMQIYGLKLFL